MQQIVKQGERLFASAKELHGEIERYLEAVQLFRELGHDPHWRAEAHSFELVARPDARFEPCEPHVSTA